MSEQSKVMVALSLDESEVQKLLGGREIGDIEDTKPIAEALHAMIEKLPEPKQHEASSGNDKRAETQEQHWEELLEFAKKQIELLCDDGKYHRFFNYRDEIPPETLQAAFDEYTQAKTDGDYTGNFTEYLSYEFYGFEYYGTTETLYESLLLPAQEDLYDSIKKAAFEVSRDFGRMFEDAFECLENGNTRWDSTNFETLLEEAGFKGIEFDVEDLLRYDFEMNLKFSTPSERNYAMGAITNMFGASLEDYSDAALDDLSDYDENALSYLIHQQGHTVSEVMDVHYAGASSDSKLVKTVSDELDNVYNGQTELMITCSASGKELLEVLDEIASQSGFVKIGVGAEVGLYNEYRFETMAIELEQPLVIPTAMIHSSQIEKNGRSGELSITDKAPELVRETPEEIQAHLKQLVNASQKEAEKKPNKDSYEKE